jgi:hypothetical protein
MLDRWMWSVLLILNDAFYVLDLFDPTRVKMV